MSGKASRDKGVVKKKRTASQLGKYKREKGEVFERAVVNESLKRGIHAKRIPGSGNRRGYKGDVMIGTHKVECKCGKQVPNFIYDKLADNYALIVKRDRKEILVVLRLEDWTP